MTRLVEDLVQTDAETPTRLLMTEDEFVAWCDEDIQAEWVDGEVIMHSPSSFRHVDLAGFLMMVLRGFVTHFDLGVVAGPEFQVRLGELRCRRVPDLFFVSKERLDRIQSNHFEGAPDLVMEIASPDSMARDWREKYWESRSAGVREYWIVDPMAQRVEAYRLAEDGEYAVIGHQEGRLASTVLPGFYLRPAWLWQETLPNPLAVLKELGVQ
jgi:Uma2 family endonuclease